MGDWHQDIVFKDVKEDELEEMAQKIFQYLVGRRIIQDKKLDNVLSDSMGHPPGENWREVVAFPEEKHFLELRTNGLEIRKGRTVFWADGSGFEKIACPHCGENNLGCDWSELFGNWMEDPQSANLVCISCHTSSSISDYIFEPTWALSNLGFVFWNWPIFNRSFIRELEQLTAKPILMVKGKL
ncbi:MAG: hypothetical protein AAFY71_10615 [Bacteroidota bacterium]